MKDLQRLADIYNERQKVHEVQFLYMGKKVIIELRAIEKEEEIGFYEWLFNPKYKVFEVFLPEEYLCKDCGGFSFNKICKSGTHTATLSGQHYIKNIWKNGKVLKQPQEIIKYILKENKW